MRLLIAVGALVALTCAKLEPAEPAPRASGQHTANAGRQVGSAADQSAEQLVSELYQRHTSGDTPFFQTESREKVHAYFEPALADLIWKDAVQSAGEAGALDFDPLYNAQDSDIQNLVIHPAKLQDGRALVVVTFNNFDRQERLTYSLVQAGVGWRIADIAYANGTTLRRLFASSGG